MLVGTDGLFEIEDRGAQGARCGVLSVRTRRERSEHVRIAFEKSDSLEALIERLRLDGGATLRDDVAVLIWVGSEVSHG